LYCLTLAYSAARSLILPAPSRVTYVM
jgi:hypothetical protein